MQTYNNYEIIVIDDGSEDHTEELIHKNYQDIVKYIKQPNKGAGAARNRGIEESQGEFIAFLDSDDMWVDFKLKLQIFLFLGKYLDQII